MARWMLGVLALFLVVYAVTVLLTGNATYLIPVAVLVAIILLGAGANRLLSRNVAKRHDSLEDAMADEQEPIPSAHLIPDDETPAGDTPEAHDEINPHDLPIDHPGRMEAERQAGDVGEDDRTTRGDRQPADRPGY
jgi:hypothetical protein